MPAVELLIRTKLLSDMAKEIKLAGKTFNVGKKISEQELKKIERKTGYTPESILRKAGQRDVGARPGAQSYAASWTPPGSSTTNTNRDNRDLSGGDTTPGPSYADFGALYQDVLLPGQLQIAQVGADATTKSATIRGEADKEVARAYADAQKYASQLGLEGVKYGADKESEWRQAVSNIEVKGKLDLQPIINAGLERVAGIEAQASRDVAETTGKYSLESMKERTAADKSIGKMQLAGSMYGLIGSMFG
jgi:hypothetical protein